MSHLPPVQVRRLLARTLRTALDGAPASQQLVDRWAAADATDDAWLAAITWDGIGATLGWALQALDLRPVAPAEPDLLAADAFEEARLQCVQLSSDLVRIGAEFAAAKIPAVALKGSALLAANLAPALGARWMGDLDILVPEARVEDAIWILESLDYERGFVRDASGPELFRPYHETFSSPDGRAVELHWRLGPARWGQAAAAETWFARARPSPMAGMMVPAAADLFWHFLLHDARNHAWSTGSLRAAFDLALVARAADFEFVEIVQRLRDDPRPEPLLEAIGDAAHLSAVLARDVEPTPEPRYLRLASWRDVLGRRRWRTRRISEAIAWGASIDRARRFGGWKNLVDRAIRIVPEGVSEGGLFATIKRTILAIRHAAFVGALALGHLIAIPGQAGRSRSYLPRQKRRSDGQ